MAGFMKIKIDYQLKRYNTFGMNVIANEFVEYKTLTDLQKIFATYSPKKWYVLGGGSNTLFTKNYEGLIIHSVAKNIELVSQDSDSLLVKADAGVVWDDFVAWCVNHNYFGAENLSYIPGSVGASPVQNIGAYGVEAKDIIHSVVFYLPEENRIEEFSAKQCEFGYRDSIFKKALRGKIIVLNVTYKLSKHFTANLSYGNLSNMLSAAQDLNAHDVRDCVISVRKEKLPDPQIMGNGGSFFKNPVVSKEFAENLMTLYPAMPYYNDTKGIKIPAGWLIEQCGWKGKKVGNVGVHERQALVIVNLGYARPQEIVDISNNIISDVKEKFGIDIYPEVNFVE